MRIIAGHFGGRTLKTVEGPGYRPATAKVRGAVFSMLEARSMDWDGARVLDVFAGSGSLAFEALSRGAAEAWCIEKNRKAVACLKQNAAALGLGKDRCRVVAGDVFSVLARPAAAPFDLICIDPPYGKNMLEPAVRSALAGDWLADGGFLLAEVETGLDMDAETLHPALESLTDRTYGQTRIMLWTLTTESSPSTPAPSTP